MSIFALGQLCQGRSVIMQRNSLFCSIFSGLILVSIISLRFMRRQGHGILADCTPLAFSLFFTTIRTSSFRMCMAWKWVSCELLVFRASFMDTRQSPPDRYFDSNQSRAQYTSYSVLRRVSTLNFSNIDEIFIFTTRNYVGITWYSHFFPL